MAINGLSDAFQTVIVPKSEYEELIRKSEQNGIIKGLLKKNKYVGQEDLKVILDMEESEEENNGN
ncbi:MAG: hypothetical protein IJZ23_07065 [Roseburia sp.]|nr:hypothetical protein [Roseburia sp.]